MKNLNADTMIVGCFALISFIAGVLIGAGITERHYKKLVEDKVAEEVEMEIHHLRQMTERKNNESKVSTEYLDLDNSDDTDEPEIEDVDEGPEDENPLQYLISKAEYEDDDTEERDYEKIDLFYEEETDTVVDSDGVECEQYDIVKEIMDSEDCYVRDDFNMTDYHVQPIAVRGENNAESES